MAMYHLYSLLYEDVSYQDRKRTQKTHMGKIEGLCYQGLDRKVIDLYMISYVPYSLETLVVPCYGQNDHFMTLLLEGLSKGEYVLFHSSNLWVEEI